jgi:Tfp pilus assembly protein PilF
MVTLAPVLNPRWLGANVFAERYLYLPSMGFCWIVAWGFRGLWRATSSRQMIWRRALVAVLSVVALLWSFRIVMRNRDWQDNITLYTRTLEASPNAELIQVNLAAAYENQGLLQEAEHEYRTVLERDPDCAKCLNDLAWLFIEQARYAEAKPLLTRAVTLDPKAVSTRLNLGIVYQKDGMIDRAEEQFRVAAALAPENVYVHTTVASFYEQQGDHSREEAALQRALSINPYYSQARISLGSLYETDRRRAEAIHEFQTILQNEPGNFEAIAALRRLQTPPNP